MDEMTPPVAFGPAAFGPAAYDPADLAVIAIGRNEGARLQACLAALHAQGLRVVYVDSASTDDSVAVARGFGMEVASLDARLPFTAARGRNAGVAHLAAAGPLPTFLQFIDGDCVLEPDWIAAALGAFAADPALMVVTGWRRERHPLANPFHAMAEVEWHAPAGPIVACGGDMMVRSAAFTAAGGFDPAIIASEDEEFVQRVLKRGGKALRLARDMTRHDIALTRLGNWWRRNLRTGNGFAEVGDLHPPHFRGERRRALLYGLALPLVALAGLVAGGVLGSPWLAFGLPVAVLALYALSTLRIWRWLAGFDFHAPLSLPKGLALRVAILFTLSKFPQALGMIRFYSRGGRRSVARLIEYK